MSRNIEKPNMNTTKCNNNVCAVCGCHISISDIGDNEFYIGCKRHKHYAQKLTGRFFTRYPDYTIWQKMNIHP